jgi:hypothetical protein
MTLDVMNAADKNNVQQLVGSELLMSFSEVKCFREVNLFAFCVTWR